MTDHYKRFSNVTLFQKDNLGSVRVMTDEQGRPWFVGKDVGEALGLGSGIKTAYTKLEESEKAHVYPAFLVDDSNNHQTTGRGGNRKPIILVSESGMYDMILSSRKPEAREFQRWITREVLPSIRENGGYIYGQENLEESNLATVRGVEKDLSMRVENLTSKKEKDS